ncbi:MAG: hypothetical protein E7A11_18005 [Clostridium sp.]|jgi:hypothetical protein|uniref:hypothetical protein n=1 Tax=Clostridium TaxID=1485 RepID=UPI000C07B486|nr:MULTISPECIES: hypothetical protein [Clostridium]MDU1096512.1 hypothetical protein [Clostridioides difficile]MDB2105034.1 hypothetical protein [Clostridium paraputrificum]MDU1127146.1 hypothetical protein [Clostridium sp.]MDU1587044.1 hypothetical protein [Clostridium sp.]MDU3678275.1 hypothetical protein [Clostridium sp.]
MKVPQYIKDSISKSALHSSIAKEENEKVRNWLDKQGLGENDYILDNLIDSIELGYDPNGFIKFLEEDKFKY